MAETATSASESGKAHSFLDRLEMYLNQILPPHQMVAEEFASTVKVAEQSYEPRFFKKYIVPNIYGFLTMKEGFDADKAKKALLAEGFDDKQLRAFASNTPSSKLRYPYKKSIVATLRAAKKDWWETVARLSHSCPDVALRSPCEHRIVFEGKLFRSGSLEMAKSALVNGIFESFFYRGLPTLLTGKDEAATAYEVGCFLAYDASPQGKLREAWSSINGKVAESCREGLGVRVMVLRVE